MAKAKKNLATQGASGKIGNIVYRQTKGGKTIMCKIPDFSNRQFSQDQLDHQDRMKLAAAYGVANKKNLLYVKKAAGTDKNAYNLALKDWFTVPVLHGIRCFEGRLRVDVTDDTMVALVTITILDPEGNVLERGDAELVNGVTWEYQPVNKGRILVQAWDLPGNKASHEFCPPAGNPYFWELSARNSQACPETLVRGK